MSNYIMSKTEASRIMAVWRATDKITVNRALNEQLEKYRIELHDMYEDVRLEASKVARGSTYFIDLNFGLRLYEFFERSIFDLDQLYNDEFWIYFTMVLCPEQAFHRWNNTFNDDRFYSTSNRIWLKQIWRYIDLGFQGSIGSTDAVLRDYTTDTILQVLDRTTGRGYDVNFTREMLLQVANLYKTSYNKKPRNVFIRDLMKYRTATNYTIAPELFEGGLKAYVQDLIEKIR